MLVPDRVRELPSSRGRKSSSPLEENAWCDLLEFTRDRRQVLILVYLDLSVEIVRLESD
jgi:hypothetical protein